MYIIRQKIKVTPEKAIFLYFGKNHMVSSNTLLSEVYDNFKDGDLPMRPAGSSKSKMPCTYCPIKKECYSKDTPVGTVQIELYETPTL
jgi:hypothetical protein